MAPPTEAAALRRKVLPVTVTVASPSFAMAPPEGAVLPVKVSPVAITSALVS